MRRPYLIVLAAIILAVVILPAALPAYAENRVVTLTFEPLSVTEKKFEVKVAHPQNTTEVRLMSGGDIVAAKQTDVSSTETVFELEADAEAHAYYADAYSFGGLLIGESEKTVFNGSIFRPQIPSWDIADGFVTEGRLTVGGNVDDTTQTVFLAMNGKIVYRTTPVDGVYQFRRVPITRNYNSVQVLAENVWGRSATKTIAVYYFGIRHKAANYTVIDKSEFSLFYIENGMIKYNFPIAIGTPKTPTPTGSFVVGQKLFTRPTCDWGARRITLLSLRKGAYTYTGYNVHGTNNPDSIGKMASHGCVRLYNEDVVTLFDKVGVGSEVFITP